MSQDIPTIVAWAPVISTTVTSLSFVVAAFAFRKTWLVNDFNLCRSLSEEIEKRWDKLSKIDDAEEYEREFVSLLNHYERVSMYLNSVSWFKTKSFTNLKSEVVESLKKHWDHPYFQDCQRRYMSSHSTYTEMRNLMTKSGGFEARPDGSLDLATSMRAS